MINPTFNSKILHSFVPVFTERADRLVASLIKFSGGDAIDLFQHVINGTMETIFVTTLGADSLSQSKAEYIVELMHRIADFVSKRAFNPLLLPQILYRFTNSYRKEVKMRATIYSVINSVSLELLNFNCNLPLFLNI
jgi:cytochrome P450 family 4